MGKAVFKNDKYRKARGGYSRLFDIRCSKCDTHLFYYQKDGPGMIKRMYLDRIYGSKTCSNLEQKTLKGLPQLVCPSCKQHIGIPMNYKKEDRLAFRLFVGSVNKKMIPSQKIKLKG